MKSITYVKNIAIFLASLIVMLPVCFADTINLFYDANGNVIQENVNGNPDLKREYNGLNQLVAVRNATNNNYIEKYTHYPLQERIWIKEVYNSSGDLSETVYYISKEFVRTINASTGQTKDYTYVWMDRQLVAQVNPDNTTYYILGDNLGSTSVVVNESGDVVENVSYNPAGDFIEGGDTTRYGYEGKEKSSVLGDIDFGFRKYYPKLKIFLQPDTLLQNLFDPQLLNRYMFERGNPYKYTDPDGHVVQAVAAVLAFTAFTISTTIIVNKISKGESPSNLDLALFGLSGVALFVSTAGLASPKVMGTAGYISYIAAEAGINVASGVSMIKDVNEILENEDEESTQTDITPSVKPDLISEQANQQVEINYIQDSSSSSSINQIGRGSSGSSSSRSGSSGGHSWWDFFNAIVKKWSKSSSKSSSQSSSNSDN